MRPFKVQLHRSLRSLFAAVVVVPIATSGLFANDVTAQRPRVLNPYRTTDAVTPESPSDLKDDFWAGSATDALASDSPKEPNRLRDYADEVVMPPTVGRFVQQELYWAFVPENQQVTTLVRDQTNMKHAVENKFRIASAIENLRSTTTASVEIVPSNPLRESFGSESRFSLKSKQNRITAVSKSIVIQQLGIVDNLMFRRALIELQDDKNVQSQWIVTGQISRYQDQPILEIRTARKSSTTSAAK